MYKRVLVPLDGSPVAEAIVPFLLEIAGPLDMEVVLLRVLQPLPAATTEVTSAVSLASVELLETDAHEYLMPVAAELQGRGVKVETLVRRGDPAREIVHAAKEAGVDLIAMTTHGRTGFGRLLFGSVAEAVLREAEIPLFLMRQTEAQVRARITGTRAR
ncbi:MAG: universal stress protein [Candidatus Rokubacteria bacterium]|nr:universal stress protein [Candidatus Rokubacteria bacterium]